MSAWKIENGILSVRGCAVLRGMSEAFSVAEDANGAGVFLHVAVSRARQKQAVWFHEKLGDVAGCARFASSHVRADSPYWQHPAAGCDLGTLPQLTTWLMVAREDGTYTMVVPLPGANACHYLSQRDDGLNVYGETGDARLVPESGVCAFVAHGDDPYALITEGAASVAKRIPSAKLRRQKKAPRFMEKFGWCTWNAFYGEVSHDKLRCGLASLRAAGVPPRAVILDDGWQTVEEIASGGHVLTAPDANAKFPGGLKPTVDMAKGEFGVEDFLVWHAVDGYWKGVAKSLVRSRETEVFYGRHTHMQPVFDWQPGLVSHVPAGKYAALYETLHTHLEACGVDGVKVDNQASLTFLGNGNGGRTKHIKAMRDALNRSVAKSFDGQLISCMANAPEIWYNARVNNLSRGSDDFLPDFPHTHGMHVYTNAMVGMWFGEFMWVDWDMFTTPHETAAFHAMARAVSGGPVYIADEPGKHDAALVRKLVFSDGSVARCNAPGRITRDALFCDALTEPALLKVFGHCHEGAAVGVFNVRYDAAGTPPVEDTICADDVPGLRAARYAVWLHNAQKLHVMARKDRALVRLGQTEADVATFAPVRTGNFAVLGLLNMFNAVAAVTRVTSNANGFCATLRDGGTFGAWTKAQPKAVRVNGTECAFEWREDGLLTAHVAAAEPCEIAVEM